MFKSLSWHSPVKQCLSEKSHLHVFFFGSVSGGSRNGSHCNANGVLVDLETKYILLVEFYLRTVPTNSKVFLPRFMIMQEM